MLESFFENSRTVGDELWGTALVDGDGSTKRRCRALARCFMALRSNSLVAGDDWVFKSLKQFSKMSGVDCNCSINTLSMLLARTGLKPCRTASLRTAGWATTSCGGQLLLTVTAPSKPGAVVENDQIRLTVLTYLLNTHSVVAAGSFCEVVSNSFV
jgi:hypothetical protein